MFTFFNSANFKSSNFNSANFKTTLILIACSIVLCLDPVATSASVTDFDCSTATELVTTGTSEGFVATESTRTFRIEVPTTGLLRLEIDTEPAGATLGVGSGPCAETDAIGDYFVARQRGRFLDLAIVEAGVVSLRLRADDQELAYLLTSSFEAAVVTEDWVSVGVGNHWHQGFETRLEPSTDTLEHNAKAPLARRALLGPADATAIGHRLEIVRAPQGRQRTLARVAWSSGYAGSFHKVEDEPNDPDPDGGAFLADPNIRGEITLGQKVEDEPNDPDPDGGAFLADPNTHGEITLGQKVEDEPNDPDPDGGAFLADPNIRGEITLGQKVEDEPNDPDPDGLAADGTHETARRVVYSSLPGSSDDEDQALRWVIGLVASELGSDEWPEGEFRLHGYGPLPNGGLDR